MAKKKTNISTGEIVSIVEPIEDPAAESVESFEPDAMQPETEEVEAQAKISNEEGVAETNSAMLDNSPVSEIPNKALAYLKRHPEDKEVYIDKLGGVFSVNTPKVFVKDAILYQNPYFKQ